MRAIIDTVVLFLDGLPGTVAAFLTLVAGTIAALILRAVVGWLFGRPLFDRLSERTGLTEFLRKGNVRYAPSKLASVLAFWIAMLYVLYRTAVRIDAGAAAAVADRLRAFLPGFAAAGIVAAIGVVLVSFLSNFATTIARNAAMRNPRLLGKGITYGGNILVVTMALEQLGLGAGIVTAIIVLLLGAVALGLALAFGLGCKDIARKAMEDLLRSLRERDRAGKGSDLEG